VVGGSRNLGARHKYFEGVFNGSRHPGYLKNHRKYESYIHRMICILHVQLFETARTYNNNNDLLKVLLITELYFKAGGSFFLPIIKMLLTFASRIVMF